MLKRIVLAALLAVSMTAQARHGAVPMVEPQPVAIPQGASSADVEKAIIDCGVNRGWTVEDKKPGAVTLKYAPRDFWLTVAVSYDARSVKIAYKDSFNLEYGSEDGKPVIHPNYNRWTNNLAHDLAGKLALASVK
jgi:hypothetical protein